MSAPQPGNGQPASARLADSANAETLPPATAPAEQQVQQARTSVPGAPVAEGPVAVDRARPPCPAAGAVGGEAGDVRARGTVPGYEILRVLGRGGMGIVYQARQTKLNRLVALKMVLAGGHAAEADVARFVTEAQAIARLQHPNVVQVYEVGEHGGLPFFSLEFCPGGSLDKKLGGTPLPPREAAALAETLARAMQAAHDKGVIHRDLKPANVLLADDGTPKITDFGLAKKLGDAAGQTASGAIVGTPSYMAPEQAMGKGKAVGPAADVYALGAILYELLTGRPPFKAATALDTALQVASEEPVPPRRLQSKVPRDVETVCLKCLQKEPRNRYPSAAELAADLRRFLDGAPVRARPAGVLERAWKWARRRPAAAALAAVVALAILALGAGLAGYGEQRRQARAEALVEALAAAHADQVPRLLEDLGTYRRQAGPLLRARAAQADPSSAARLHLALALADADDGEAEFLAGRLLTAAPEDVGLVRDALRPRAGSLAERYWATLLDPKADAGRRLRAASALAAYEPEAGRWADVSGGVVNALVRENLLLVPRWAEALRPVRGRLVPALAAVFRDAGRSEGERELATALLAEYVKDQPEPLTDLLLDADPKAYAALFPLVERHRERAVGLLIAELDRTPARDWKDPPLDPAWAAPDPALVRQMEAAGGLVAERFALCQTLPLGQFEPVAAALRRCGYRPIRLRPYMVAAGSPRVAAVWERDGRGWAAAHGLTAEEVRRQDGEWRKKGRGAVDVAGYLDGGRERYAVVWAEGMEGPPSEMDVGVPEAQQVAAWDAKSTDHVAFAQHCSVGADGQYRYCYLWRKMEMAWTSEKLQDEGQLAGGAVSYGVPVDVSLTCQKGAARDDRAEVLAWLTALPWCGLALRDHALLVPHPERSYAGVWHVRPELEGAQALGLTPEEQQARARELARAGYRPASLSVTDFGEGLLLTASVWHRPAVPDEVKERLAKRRASAAATLLRLGEAERVWPLLRHRPDPRLRSYLIHRLSPLGADARSLVRRLAEEPDVSARRALLLCLGEFGPEQLPPPERDALVPALLRMYREDPDPGLHGAAEWLLRQWRQADRLPEIDRELSTGKVAGGRRWYVNGQGQTFAVVPGPVEFLMGSPRSEAGRERGPEGTWEGQHRRRIGRTFALATKDVTVAQFLRFSKDHNYDKHVSPTPAHPVNNVTWYDAAAYCNWLSKEEGIPEDQWCYLPNKEGKYAEGMRMRPNYLSLTGYRLPTEAEWECACRAGALTSRYFGGAEELLGRYAWCAKNSQGREALAPGNLKPNDLGLFDMLGNARQWCLGLSSEYPGGSHGEAVPDTEDGSLEGSIADAEKFELRGGTLFSLPGDVRSAARAWDLPDSDNTDVSFRPARTLR